jgi:hypothetical protein
LNLSGGTQVQYATTDASGDYSFTGLPAAGYILNFSAAYGQDYVAQWWGDQPTQATANVLQLRAGQSASGINVTLAVAATVSGTVESQGSPNAPVAFDSVSVIASGGSTVGFGSTDANGNFSIPGIAPGSYTVQFSAPFGSSFSEQWWDGASTLATATYFSVNPGQSLTGIDALLTLGATISGTVDGQDAPGVAVPFGSVAAVDTTGTSVAFGQVGSDGTYTISGVPAGSLTLEFQPPFGSDYSTGWWQDETSLASADFFSVAAGAALTGYDGDLPVGASISGTLNGAGSPLVPLAGGFVSASSIADPTVGNSAPVNSDGTYTIGGLAAGSYTVNFQAPYPDTNAQLWWNSALSRSTATTVTVAAGQAVTGINEVLPLGATISGTVQGRTASGSVFPAANATVLVYLPNGVLVSDSNYADSSGDYTIGNLAPGAYKLEFEPQGDTTDFVPQLWWNNKPTEATATVITVKAGQTVPNVNAVLPAAIIKPGIPSIDGSATVGHTLTVNPGTWCPAAVTLAYQWLRAGTPIAGATGQTYRLTNADAGSPISVTVTGSETGFPSTSRSSSPTPVVTGGTLTSAVPTIVGTAARGHVLTAVPGTWGPGTVAFSYKWFRDSSQIGGASGHTYTLVQSDVGKVITVQVTGSERGFTSASRVSAPTSVVR